jgi:hypothetical protein
MSGDLGGFEMIVWGYRFFFPSEDAGTRYPGPDSVSDMLTSNLLQERNENFLAVTTTVQLKSLHILHTPNVFSYCFGVEHGKNDGKKERGFDSSSRRMPINHPTQTNTCVLGITKSSHRPTSPVTIIKKKRSINHGENINSYEYPSRYSHCHDPFCDWFHR